jgi:hypothetical protein
VSERPAKPSLRKLWIALGILAAIFVVGFEIVATKPVREAVRAYTQLIDAANRLDLDAACAVCTDRYLAKHSMKLAQEGGIIGLPRNINKNFQSWREGQEVWLCPTNRVGPVYRFVNEKGNWKFDGVVGQLMPGGRVEPMEETEMTDPK